MANFFIKRPIFAIVVALVITIAGALCIFSLPIDPHPTPTQRSRRRRSLSMRPIRALTLKS